MPVMVDCPGCMRSHEWPAHATAPAPPRGEEEEGYESGGPQGWVPTKPAPAEMCGTGHTGPCAKDCACDMALAVKNAPAEGGDAAFEKWHTRRVAVSRAHRGLRKISLCRDRCFEAYRAGQAVAEDDAAIIRALYKSADLHRAEIAALRSDLAAAKARVAVLEVGTVSSSEDKLRQQLQVEMAERWSAERELEAARGALEEIADGNEKLSRYEMMDKAAVVLDRLTPPKDRP